MLTDDEARWHGSGMQYQFYIYHPDRAARYYAIEALDQGGFGFVWSGVTAEGFPIAIKIFKPTSDFQRDFDSWFTEQSIYLKCLQHQHIVTTYDQFYSPEYGLIIVMEKADGSLEDSLIQCGRFDPASVCGLGCQILSGLYYIHNLGIVHRDVSLKNILRFPKGIFKLADFGISKQGVGIGEYTRTFVGNKSFIPPELIDAGYSTHQSDIYQLGLVLLTLLTGQHPISPNASPDETRRMILEGIPRQIAESLITTQGNLAEIISIMLRRRDKWRYRSALDVWKDLDNEFKHQERSA